jgi:hypothetical protein
MQEYSNDVCSRNSKTRRLAAVDHRIYGFIMLKEMEKNQREKETNRDFYW